MDVLIMLMLVSMTLTLMQDQNGSAKAKNQRCMLPATKQALNWLQRDLDLDFANIYMACPTYFFSPPPVCSVFVFSCHRL